MALKPLSAAATTSQPSHLHMLLVHLRQVSKQAARAHDAKAGSHLSGRGTGTPFQLQSLCTRVGALCQVWTGGGQWPPSSGICMPGGERQAARAHSKHSHACCMRGQASLSN